MPAPQSARQLGFCFAGEAEKPYNLPDLFSIGTAMEDQRIAREREFHDQVFDDGGRTKIRKFYSVTGSANQKYADVALEKCQGKRVLELGCGPGSLAFRLSEHGADAVGIDISPIAIQQAQDTASERGLSCTFTEMNAEALTFEDNTFDIICGSGILHHLDLENVYTELSRVLKPGGRAVFFEPLGHNWFVNFYRWLTPKLRTPDEHPLLERDIEHAARHFKAVKPHFFVLLTLLLFPFRKMNFFSALIGKVESIEKALLKRIPFLRRYSWILVLELGN